MKIVTISVQVALLYVFYFVGDGLQNWLNLPVPGSIIGMLLLFTALLVKAFPVKWIEKGAGFLLAYLPLLFIPVTVGVMDYYHIFAGNGFVLPLIVLLSTLLVMVTAGMTSEWLAKRKEQKPCQDGSS